MKKATFGAGCFWGVEAAFRKLKGVSEAVSGYSGGSVENPTYEQVCGKNTGHAEVVQVEYDPETISYQQLLDTFFQIHDPTQVNRQGPDIGDQYRSVIFYHDEDQKQAAEQAIEALHEAGKFNRPIATLVEEAKPFYRAEEYHQRYYEKCGRVF